jgi:very-short-patch-repair endonuclease
VKFPTITAEISSELNPNINVYAISHCSRNEYYWQCSNNGEHIWKASVNSRTRRGTGCPSCRESHLEKRCREVLINLDRTYQTQKEFLGCIYRQQLRYDYYIPSLNLCIELDGIQHFEPTHFLNNSTNSFIENKQRDSIKNNFCKSQNINLLRISYSEINNMERHIVSYIEALTEHRKNNPNTSLHIFCGNEYHDEITK